MRWRLLTAASFTSSLQRRGPRRLQSRIIFAVEQLEDRTFLSVVPVITLGGSSGTETDGQTQVFTWSVTNTGGSAVDVEIRKINAPAPLLDSAAASGSFNFDANGLGDYIIDVKTYDAVGPTGLARQSVTVVDDVTAPPTIVLGGSSGNETDAQTQVFTWDVTDAAGLANVSAQFYKIVSGNYVLISASTNASGSLNFDSYGTGDFDIEVSATDTDNDWAPIFPATDASTRLENRSVSVRAVGDVTYAPTIVLGGSQGIETDAQTQNFTWNVISAAGNPTVSAGIGRVGEGVVVNSTDPSGSVNFDYYGPGDYFFTVYATDANGANGIRRFVTVVDDDPDSPAITLGGSSGVETIAQTQAFTWGVTDPSGLSALTVHIEKTGAGTLLDSTDASGSFNFDSFGPGFYSISILATDADGEGTRAPFDTSTRGARRAVTVTATQRYDFGAANSPVAAGYAVVTGATSFSPQTGYGWLSGANPVNSFDTQFTGVTNPDPNLTRDFNYTTNGTFAAVVDHGFYDVTLTLGDARSFAYPQLVSFGGVPTDTVSTGGANPAVVTKTYVVPANSGRLDIGVAAAAGGSYAVVDGITLAPDAFLVASSIPANAGSVAGPISQINVAFSHAFGAGALVTGNYSLAGPAGNLTITGVAQVNATTVSLLLASPTAPGNYVLTVGQALRDSFGFALAATGNVSFTALPSPNKFDFGVAASPVAAGYTQVTASTAYNPATGFGWLSGPNAINGLDTSSTSNPTPDPNITRDFNYSGGATFTAAAINGLYDVTLTLGDARGFNYPMSIYFGGSTTATDMLRTGGTSPAVVNRTYVVAVTNGRLDVGIAAAAGGSYGVIDGVSFVPDNTPFSVISSTPAAGATVSGSLGQMDVVFNHPVGAAALIAGNYSLSGPSTIAVAGVTQIDSKTVALTFAAPLTPGSWTLTANTTNIVDAIGNSLGASGATIHFNDIAGSASLQFDFGTPSSPVAGGYLPVNQATVYGATLGYGWLSGAVTSLDTGITTFTSPDANLTRDLIYTNDATFGVGLANGSYNVTLTVGDAGSYSYAMGVYFQGSASPTDTIHTGQGNGTFVTRTYVVNVTNGQLRLEMTAAAGAWTVIDGLTITPHG